MNILRPIPVEKRLPCIPDQELFSAAVIVNFKTGTTSDVSKAFAYCDKNNNWHDAQGFESGKEIHFSRTGNNQVIEWYEEIEIESLFPDDKKSVLVAANASGKSFAKMLSHQEGQTYFQNHLLKKLLS